MFTDKSKVIRNAYRNIVHIHKTAMPKTSWYTPEHYIDGIATNSSFNYTNTTMPNEDSLTIKNILAYVQRLTPGSLLTIEIDYKDGK